MSKTQDPEVSLAFRRFDKLLAKVLLAAPEIHWRKCHDCNNEGLHVNSTVPWSVCDRCGSHDTRPLENRPVSML